MPEFKVPANVWIHFNQSNLERPVTGQLSYKIVNLDRKPSDIHVRLAAGGTQVEIKLIGMAKKPQSERTLAFRTAAVLLEKQLATQGAFGVIGYDDDPIYVRLKRRNTKKANFTPSKRKDDVGAKDVKQTPWNEKLWNVETET